MIKCPRCGSTNIIMLENKIVSIKTLILLAVAFVGLYALSDYLNVNIIEALVPAVVIYLGALAGLVLVNRNRKPMKCQDCFKNWRQNSN